MQDSGLLCIFFPDDRKFDLQDEYKNEDFNDVHMTAAEQHGGRDETTATVLHRSTAVTGS